MTCSGSLCFHFSSQYALLVAVHTSRRSTHFSSQYALLVAVRTSRRSTHFSSQYTLLVAVHTSRRSTHFSSQYTLLVAVHPSRRSTPARRCVCMNARHIRCAVLVHHRVVGAARQCHCVDSHIERHHYIIIFIFIAVLHHTTVATSVSFIKSLPRRCVVHEFMFAIFAFLFLRKQCQRSVLVSTLQSITATVQR